MTFDSSLPHPTASFVCLFFFFVRLLYCVNSLKRTFPHYDSLSFITAHIHLDFLACRSCCRSCTEYRANHNSIVVIFVFSSYWLKCLIFSCTSTMFITPSNLLLYFHHVDETIKFVLMINTTVYSSSLTRAACDSRSHRTKRVLCFSTDDLGARIRGDCDADQAGGEWDIPVSSLLARGRKRPLSHLRGLRLAVQ